MNDRQKVTPRAEQSGESNSRSSPSGRSGSAPPASARRDIDRPSERLADMAVLTAGGVRDLVGPVSYVLSNLEFLDAELAGHDADLPPGRVAELRQCLREAMVGATRIRDVVREVNDLGRSPRSGELVDLHELLLNCIKVARTEIDHRARVITEFDAVPPVPGNESRLSRLFVNLLVNAAQAVAGDPNNEHFIRVVTRNEPGRRVSVDVSDSGPGISTEYLERIFEPFFTTKPATEGTGLGLSICRQIVSGLGGTLTVESAPGRGATFRVTLPASELDEQKPRESDHPFSTSRPPVRRLKHRRQG